MAIGAPKGVRLMRLRRFPSPSRPPTFLWENKEGHLPAREAKQRSSPIHSLVVDPALGVVGRRSFCERQMTLSTPAGTSFGAQLLPSLLSVIAGTTDVISFLGLGGLFTAHITGNLVILAAHSSNGTAHFGAILSVRWPFRTPSCRSRSKERRLPP